SPPRSPRLPRSFACPPQRCRGSVGPAATLPPARRVGRSCRTTRRTSSAAPPWPPDRASSGVLAPDHCACVEPRRQSRGASSPSTRRGSRGPLLRAHYPPPPLVCPPPIPHPAAPRNSGFRPYILGPPRTSRWTGRSLKPYPSGLSLHAAAFTPGVST